ncbi:MAG: acyltransferase domain-containing protein [Caldilineaceae bacterium]
MTLPTALFTSTPSWRIGPPAPRQAAGISSFGVGGTNAHVVVEEAPPLTGAASERAHHLLLLSAKSAAALDAMTANLHRYLQTQPNVDLADLAYTPRLAAALFRIAACRGRQRRRCRANVGHARFQMRIYPPHNADGTAGGFYVPGQGKQHVNMGRDLYEQEAIFRTTMDQCCELLQPHLGFDLREVLYPAPENLTRAQTEINQTLIAQPAIFAVSYALAQLWIARRSAPGHDRPQRGGICGGLLGQCFFIGRRAMLVAERGRLTVALPGGSMLAVRLAEAELRPLLSAELEIATINGPTLCAVAGPTPAIAQLQTQLEARYCVPTAVHVARFPLRHDGVGRGALCPDRADGCHASAADPHCVHRQRRLARG